MTVRGVLRDGAIAFLAGTVISARVGAPERAGDDGATRRRWARGDGERTRERVVVWCDVSSVGRGAIARGDVVMVRRPLGSSIGAGRVAIQRVAKDESDGLARGGAPGARQRRARGRDDDGGGDVGEVPSGCDTRTRRRGVVAAERDGRGEARGGGWRLRRIVVV